MYDFIGRHLVFGEILEQALFDMPKGTVLISSFYIILPIYCLNRFGSLYLKIEV